MDDEIISFRMIRDAWTLLRVLQLSQVYIVTDVIIFFKENSMDNFAEKNSRGVRGSEND